MPPGCERGALPHPVVCLLVLLLLLVGTGRVSVCMDCVEKRPTPRGVLAPGLAFVFEKARPSTVDITQELNVLTTSIIGPGGENKGVFR